MGVPAFYRWISEKYAKIVVDMLEKRPTVIEGTIIPLNLQEHNPNGIEYDNLYVDMNGLIHPCSHPEDREPPKTEAEMYINVTKYLDRLVAAVRPRRVLYLAVDGVAPRAKMNQQRSRRFRAAQDVKEKKQMMDEVIAEMVAMGYDAPEEKEGGNWDSNVITPGTEFMTKLSDYIRFYIIDRMNRDPYWKGITVVFSDASEPGEGEHKIMDFVRNQRSQPGYDPNQRHILHGLDADLIMLALATHEAHFTILREKVTFGKRRDEPEISEGQRMLNAQSMRNGVLVSCLNPQDEWVYKTPLQALHVNVLREYLDNEFSCLKHSLPFGYDLERVIDDFIFICFFVGNDFLPHLPSLDIRDGALDFLMECYKELLPSLGDYVTSPGGHLNLRQADVILGRVGEIEDQIFIQRKRAEDNEERRRQERFGNRGSNGNGAANNGQRITAGGGGNSGRQGDHQRFQAGNPQQGAGVPARQPSNSNVSAPVAGPPAQAPASGPAAAHSVGENKAAADALRQSLLGKRPASVAVDPSPQADVPVVEAVADAIETPPAEGVDDLAADVESPAPTDDISDDESTEGSVVAHIDPVALVPKLVPKSMTAAEIERAKEELKRRVKEKEHALIERNKETVKDEVKLHEAGWKERYYGEKYKKENIEKGGGLKRMTYTYVQGLAWVLRYYYQGVPSWNWYYPFHYAPFASDLRNIDSYGEITFELSEPFRPIEQLLAVFPANSVKALPEPCHWLMTDPTSPIIDLYDEDVPIDPNGKHLPWLWILLLPFVDERRITAAFELCRSKLSLEDAKRNKFGRPALFMHKEHPLGSFATGNLRYMPGAETDAEVLRALAEERKKMKLMYDGELEEGRGSGEVAVTDTVVPSADTARLPFDPIVGNGMSGVLAPPPPTFYAPLHALVKPPADQTFAFQDIRDNKVLCYTYTLLPMPHVHESKLLDGVVPQQSILTQFDLMHRRPPRLNKGGFNIMDIFQNLKEKEQRSQGAYNYGYNGYGNYSQLQYGFQPQYQQREQYESQTMAYSGNKAPRSYGSYGGGAPGQQYAPRQQYGQRDQSYQQGYQQPYQQSYQQQDRRYPPSYAPPAAHAGGGAPDRYPASYQAPPQFPPSYQQNYQPPASYRAPPQQVYQTYPPAQQQQPQHVGYGAPPFAPPRQAPPVEHTVTQLKDRDIQRAAVLGSHRVDRSVPIGAYGRPAAGSGGGGGRQAVFLDTLPVQPAPVAPAQKFRHSASSSAPAARAQSSHSFAQPARGAPSGVVGGGADSLQSIRDQLFKTLQQAQQPPR
jgi:5'-3' exoribonuclease 2